ncbi:MAG: hypothetical protein IKJ88_03820 [Clostridia bacterium]|nr:hypothetical protein [Clostridia bacterium]
MTQINKDIEKYISDVGTHLFCLKKNKKAVLADMREAICEFTENNEVNSIDDIYKRFGTPEEIAKAYIADTEPKNIKKAVNIRKLIVIAVVIALVMLAVSFAIAIFDSHKQNISYYYNSDIVTDASIP